MLTKCRRCWPRRRDAKRGFKKELKSCVCCSFTKNEEWALAYPMAPVECMQSPPILSLLPILPALLLFTLHLATETFQMYSQVSQPLAATIAPIPLSPMLVILHHPPEWMNSGLPTGRPSHH